MNSFPRTRGVQKWKPTQLGFRRARVRSLQLRRARACEMKQILRTCRLLERAAYGRKKTGSHRSRLGKQTLSFVVRNVEPRCSRPGEGRSGARCESPQADGRVGRDKFP